MAYTEVSKCRICGNERLLKILNLGVQTLTGVFPRSRDERITEGPLVLVKCDEAQHSSGSSEGGCGLVQLLHSYDLDEMYGDNYGYRSGLNKSMVAHLTALAGRARSMVDLQAGDVVLDIGSNDGTTLGTHPEGLTLIGIDPTAGKFRQYYRDDIQIVEDFFTAANFERALPGRKAKIITSIAMFYDLESPTDFMRDIHRVLDDEGIWVFEQSYLKTMLERLAYDTVCHEHLLYYGLKQIKWMADEVGFKIIDVDLNDTNGGSFRITVAKSDSQLEGNPALVEKLLAEEEEYGLGGLEVYESFSREVDKHREELIAFIKQAQAEGKTVYGYGASTKGNVVLQYCGLTSDDIPAIAEVNEEKFGAFTPRTLIPIAAESDVRAKKPDYMLVLPWHFRDTIIEREREYLQSGGKLLFPLPRIDVVGA